VSGVGLHFHLDDLVAVKGIAVPGAVGQGVAANAVAQVTGVSIVSLHHDLSTVAGEEVILFTLVTPPAIRDARKKYRPPAVVAIRAPASARQVIRRTQAVGLPAARSLIRVTRHHRDSNQTI
jgi:hypothetical protein